MKNMIVALASVFLACTQNPAGERLLGVIVSDAGPSISNATTQTPFVVNDRTKLTIWCNDSAFVCVNQASDCSSTTGLPLSAYEKFPTSAEMGPYVNVGQTITYVDAGNPDGGAGIVTDAGYLTGGTRSNIVSVYKWDAGVACYTYARQGTE